MPSPSATNASVFAQVLVANAINLATNTAVNLLSFNLGAGTWNLTGITHFIPAATTSVTNLLAGFNSVITTLPTADASLVQSSTAANVLVTPQDLSVGDFQVVLSVAATFYLNIKATFTVSTMTASGYIYAVQTSA